METKLESVTSPNQLETTTSNTTNSRSVDDDTAHVPVTTPEVLLPLTTDDAVQLNIPAKETEEKLGDIKYPETTEMPEGMTHENELKPEQIGISAVKPGLICKNKDVVDMKTESGIQEILSDQAEESRFKSTEKENMTCTMISEDHKLAETTVPTLDADTGCQEDKALVNYFITTILQLLVSELLF